MGFFENIGYFLGSAYDQINPFDKEKRTFGTGGKERQQSRKQQKRAGYSAIRSLTDANKSVTDTSQPSFGGGDLRDKNYLNTLSEGFKFDPEKTYYFRPVGVGRLVKGTIGQANTSIKDVRKFHTEKKREYFNKLLELSQQGDTAAANSIIALKQEGAWDERAFSERLYATGIDTLDKISSSTYKPLLRTPLSKVPGIGQPFKDQIAEEKYTLPPVGSSEAAIQDISTGGAFAFDIVAIIAGGQGAVKGAQAAAKLGARGGKLGQAVGKAGAKLSSTKGGRLAARVGGETAVDVGLAAGRGEFGADVAVLTGGAGALDYLISGGRFGRGARAAKKAATKTPSVAQATTPPFKLKEGAIKSTPVIKSSPINVPSADTLDKLIKDQARIIRSDDYKAAVQRGDTAKAASLTKPLKDKVAELTSGGGINTYELQKALKNLETDDLVDKLLVNQAEILNSPKYRALRQEGKLDEAAALLKSVEGEITKVSGGRVDKARVGLAVEQVQSKQIEDLITKQIKVLQSPEYRKIANSTDYITPERKLRDLNKLTKPIRDELQALTPRQITNKEVSRAYERLKSVEAKAGEAAELELKQVTRELKRKDRPTLLTNVKKEIRSSKQAIKSYIAKSLPSPTPSKAASVKKTLVDQGITPEDYRALPKAKDNTPKLPPVSKQVDDIVTRVNNPDFDFIVEGDGVVKDILKLSDKQRLEALGRIAYIDPDRLRQGAKYKARTTKITKAERLQIQSLGKTGASENSIKVINDLKTKLGDLASVSGRAIDKQLYAMASIAADKLGSSSGAALKAHGLSGLLFDPDTYTPPKFQEMMLSNQLWAPDKLADTKKAILKVYEDDAKRFLDKTGKTGKYFTDGELKPPIKAELEDNIKRLADIRAKVPPDPHKLNTPAYRKVKYEYETAWAALVRSSDRLLTGGGVKRLGKTSTATYVSNLLSSPTTLRNITVGNLFQIVLKDVEEVLAGFYQRFALPGGGFGRLPAGGRARGTVTAIAKKYKLLINQTARAIPLTQWKSAIKNSDAVGRAFQTAEGFSGVAGDRAVHVIRNRAARLYNNFIMANLTAADTVARTSTKYQTQIVDTKKLVKQYRRAGFEITDEARKKLLKDVDAIYTTTNTSAAARRQVDVSYQNWRDFMEDYYTNVHKTSPDKLGNRINDHLNLYDREANVVALSDSHQLWGRAGWLSQKTTKYSVLKIPLPIVRAPANSLGKLLELAPGVGFVKAHGDYIYFKDKGLLRQSKQEAVAYALAKQTIGLSLGVAAYNLTRAHLYNGAYPTDRATQEIWQRDGIQPYSLSVNLFGKRASLSLDAFAPVLGPMAGGLAWGEKVNKEENENVQDVMDGIGNYGKHIAESVAEHPFFATPGKVYGIIRSDEESAKRKVQTQLVDPMASNFIPNAFKFLAKTLDPTQPDVKTSPFWDRWFLQHTPGVRSKFKNKRLLGTEKRQAGGLAALLGVNMGSDDQLGQELARLYDATGEYRTNFSAGKITRNGVLGFLRGDEQTREQLKRELTRGADAITDKDVNYLHDAYIMRLTDEMYKMNDSDQYKQADDQQKEELHGLLKTTVRQGVVRRFLKGRGYGDHLSKPSRAVSEFLKNKEVDYRIPGEDLTSVQELADLQTKLKTAPVDERDNLERDIALKKVEVDWSAKPEVIDFYKQPSIDITTKLNRIYREDGRQASIDFYTDLADYSQELFASGGQPSRSYAKFFNKGGLKQPEGWLAAGVGKSKKRSYSLGSSIPKSSGVGRGLTARQFQKFFGSYDI